MYWHSDEWEQLGCEVLNDRPDLQWIRTRGFQICFLASDKEKKSSGQAVFAECIRVPEIYQALTMYDFLIVIYLPNIADLNTEQKRILMYHELLHIGIDGNGSAKIVPHDIEDFRTIIEKYGIDWAK